MKDLFLSKLSHHGFRVLQPIHDALWLEANGSHALCDSGLKIVLEMERGCTTPPFVLADCDLAQLLILFRQGDHSI
jgi:hypothetical protein